MYALCLRHPWEFRQGMLFPGLAVVVQIAWQKKTQIMVARMPRNRQ